MSFRVARLQFNGANPNDSPDMYTPPWPSISRGQIYREREMERETERERENTRETAKS